MINRRALSLFLGTAALYTAFFSGRHLWVEWRSTVRLETSKPSYGHDEFVEILLWTRDEAVQEVLRRDPPRAVVTRWGEKVRTIAGIEVVPLAYDGGRRVWAGRWPCPWNAPDGEYVPVVLGAAFPRERLRTRPFRIAYRKPAPIPRGLVVLTLESLAPLAGMRVASPSGETKDWRGLLDWAEYVGADAFWVMGGRTPGNGPGEVWDSGNNRILPKLAAECRRRGIRLGLYAMCYLTTSRDVRLPRYEYAQDVSEGLVVPTRAVSMRDPLRAGDIGDLLRQFSDIPGVDYLGIDYIRNALGGVELVDDFLADFPSLKPPPGWPSLSREERMVWLARKKGMRRDLPFIDAWQWWRAHKAAGIVRVIKERIGDAKPLWAFTLAWDKGWHHGQDPVMMNDAGVDIDALMLYEATEDQFEVILKDWHRYVLRPQVQIIVGNIIDWPLHQRSPLGPKAFYGRLARAMDRIYGDGPARGVFFHDIERALQGRLGAWTTRQWLDEARRAALRLKSLKEAAR